MPRKSLEEKLEKAQKAKPKSLVKRKRSPKAKTKPRLRKKPGTYVEARALYGTKEYKDWRLLVLERDNHRCQMCGQIGGRLEVHHIRPKYLYPELTLDVKNGITLCWFCHQDRVTKYEDKFIYIFDKIVKLNSKKGE